MTAFMEHVGYLTDEEIDATQHIIQERRAVLNGLHSAVVAERITRNGAPNQMVLDMAN